MKKLSFVLAAAGLISLAACNKPAETTNAVENAVDNAVEAVEAAAENGVNTVEAAAENASNAM